MNMIKILVIHEARTEHAKEVRKIIFLPLVMNKI